MCLAAVGSSRLDIGCNDPQKNKMSFANICTSNMSLSESDRLRW